jgi:hypothetical protein
LKPKRLRAATVLACGGAMVTVALTGCKAEVGGGSAAPSTSANSSAQPSSSGSGQASSGTSGSGGGGGSKAPVGQTGAARCLSTELRADIQAQESHSEEEGFGTLILTNKSGRTCLIPSGWAPIGSGGPNYQALTATRENYPGPGTNITLRSGRSVFAGLKWRTSPDCGATSGLGVSWYNSWIPVRYLGGPTGKPPICDSLSLGTIQPIMNGVNFT